MKMIIEHTESEGLESLLGEVITVFCASWIYTRQEVFAKALC